MTDICHGVRALFCGVNPGYAPVDTDDDAMSETTVTEIDDAMSETSTITDQRTAQENKRALSHKLFTASGLLGASSCLVALFAHSILIDYPILIALIVGLSVGSFLCLVEAIA